MNSENKTSTIHNLLNPHQNANLKSCYLEGLNLQALPEDFFHLLPNLTWLDLRSNVLSEIPVSITNHAHLETILLQNNAFVKLPLYLGTLKKLQCLQLKDNPIEFPKRGILERGTKYVLKYLKDLYESKDTSPENAEMGEYHKTKKDKRRKSSWETSRRIFQFQVQSTLDRCKLGEKCERSIWRRNSERYIKPETVRREIQDLKIKDAICREELLQKKKELLGRREKMLQDRKSLEALKHWRRGYEEDKSSNTHIYYALNLSNLPYDTDLEFVKILTRADIEKDLPDKYTKSAKRNKTIKKKVDSKLRGEEVEMKISELLETLETEDSQFVDCTPRTEKKATIDEIKRLTKLQKQIVNLKIANHGT